MTPTLEPLGDGAVRFARPPNKTAAEILAEVRAWPNVIDATLTESWVAVYFADTAKLGNPGLKPGACKGSLLELDQSPPQGRAPI